MQFATLRLIVIILAVAAQVYLYARARQATQLSRRSAVFKFRAIRIIGATIALLFVGNVYIMIRPIPWVDPPTAAQVVLFYPPAVWGFGSIFSAVLLFLTSIGARTGRMLVRFYRGFPGRTLFLPPNPGRRSFLKAGVGGIAAAP